MPHIPMLYQLSYQEFTLRYGLSREEIQEFIDNPDRRVPTQGGSLRELVLSRFMVQSSRMSLFF
jgi:hypothetical protein